MRPRGDSTRVIIEEPSPHEFLLDPRHPFKEIRGTKYFEHGSATLQELNALTSQYVREYEIDFTNKSMPKGLLVTGLFSGIKYNSVDINCFVREKTQSWITLGYKIGHMPPKCSSRKDPTDESHLLQHGIPLARKPSVVYAYLGAKNPVVKGSLARALFELGLISFEEISVKFSDGRCIMANRWDYTEMVEHEK